MSADAEAVKKQKLKRDVALAAVDALFQPVLPEAEDWILANFPGAEIWLEVLAGADPVPEKDVSAGYVVLPDFDFGKRMAVKFTERGEELSFRLRLSGEDTVGFRLRDIARLTFHSQTVSVTNFLHDGSGSGVSSAYYGDLTKKVLNKKTWAEDDVPDETLILKLVQGGVRAAANDFVGQFKKALDAEAAVRPFVPTPHQVQYIPTPWGPVPVPRQPAPGGKP